MAVLKQIKFGSSATPIAQTVVTAASESVLSVNGTHTDLTDNNDPSYEVDLRIDNDTLVKSNDTNKVLKVGTVPAAQVSVADSSEKFTGTNVETVLAELQTNINKVDGAARTYTVVDDTANVQDLPTNVLKRYRLQEIIGSQSPTLVGANIDIPKDSSLKEVYLGASTDTIDATTGVITKNTVTDPQSMNFAYQLADGTYSLTKIDVSKFLTESEFGDGLEVSNAGEVSAKLGQGLEFGSESNKNKSIKVKIDSTSEQDGQATPADFLTVGANGVKVQGIKTEITRQIQALDNTDTASTGQVVTAVSTADGIASPTKANLAGITLGGFTQDADATGAIADTDTLGDALNKLENAIDAAAEAAEDAHTVVEHASGNTHVTVAGAENANGGMTYTVSETNIASASDLTAEVTRAQSAETAIDSAVGLRKDASGEGRTFTPTSNYGGASTESPATSVIDNMQKIDTALKAVSDKANSIQYKVDGTTLEFFGMTEKTGA